MPEETTPTPDDTVPRQPDEQPDRQAQPVDAEQPPRLPFPVVGVGASAGGLEAFTEFLGAMRPDAGMAFVLVQHLPPDHESMMAEILGRKTAMPVHQVEDGMPVEPDHVYVIRPGHVLTIREGRLHLGPVLGAPRAANRPIDDFFKSLAEEQRERAVCVIMSGMGSNGTAGAQAVKAVGGLCVAQDPESAQFPSMPRHLIDAGYADYVLRPADIPDVLLTYARSPYATGGREADAAAALEREQQHLREVLAVLRTRTKQDFSGYKKPTVLRRVQRRMGLSRVTRLADYARLLRQTPGEVQSLADDLLIHVTGFFRDPEAWEALRVRVVAPLVAAREYGALVRAWVTACSSGEEAYSLAMLLVEEAERAGKHLDVKVFATDLADRALSNARAGVYPGGIESEITPERLARFFVKDDEVYRVRQELRDRVVFAPQNVLQDPPFSRLDIATCRNLLIYLEPEVQHRVLALLHFGLREGGTLFLGTSETIAGAEELFEPLDKKARLYRRVGPTRYGAVDFPLPHALPGGGPAPPGRHRPHRQEGVLPSVAEITQRVLLEHHTPPAVTIDRDHRVLYFHGDTRPYLLQPTGEPTRDLMLLARDGVRGAIRVALHRAAAENAPATALDGWVDVGSGGRTRVAVTVSPVPGAGSNDAPGYYVISFAEIEDVPLVPPTGDGEQSVDEFRRLRAELQSTIEELQTSNEELKASNEEVMSINEEMQSANEELETSKEEMQSLNEELSTVNAQLRAKMEEHQATSSDLASLLASTDIAVLFLDRAFCIRRYTPAARELVDLIAADVGRPLAALARKFDDPHLDADVRAVLERLVPAEREVAGADGRHYLRRVTPYRTTDNRIDGVVVAFVDITARKRAEEALQESERQLAGELAGAKALQAISGRLITESDPEALHAQLLAAAAELMAADAASFQLLDPDGRTLRLLVSRGFHPESATHWVRVGADSSTSCGRALKTGRRCIVPDVDAADPPLGGADLREYHRSGIRAVQSTPLVSRGGRPLGMLSTHWRRPHAPPERDFRLFDVLARQAADLIDRTAAEAALRASEERLTVALAAARMGTWTLDVAAGVQTRGPNLNRLLGLEAVETTGPFAEFFEHIHPDDRAAVRAAFDAAAAGGRRLSVEFRVVRPDGAVRWLRDQGDVFPTDGGPRMAGACVDVTERRDVEEALRASEERLRLILASATDFAILTLAPDRTVTSWSPGAATAFGYDESEIVGQSGDILFTPEDRAAGAPEAEADTARRDGRAADERWHLRKDGSRFFASGVLTPLRDGGLHGFVKVARDLTDRKRMEDELREARDRLEERVAERTAELAQEMARRADLARRLVSAQEDERRRISRELHDSVGQLLAGLALAVKAVEAAGPLAPPAAGRLAEVQRVADVLGKEVHALALRLRPTSLDDLGLEAALEQLVSEWSSRDGVRAGFHSAGLGPNRLVPEAETVLYRVVQEALTNIVKHARATQVSVTVSRQDGVVTAVVEDNGAGFDPSAVPKGRLGLLGMRERAALVGGEVDIESRPGAGTTVAVRVPVGGGRE